MASEDLSHNGDDAIEVYEQGLLIETFGDVDVDGTGHGSIQTLGLIISMVFGLMVLIVKVVFILFVLKQRVVLM